MDVNVASFPLLGALKLNKTKVAGKGHLSLAAPRTPRTTNGERTSLHHVYGGLFIIYLEFCMLRDV